MSTNYQKAMDLADHIAEVNESPRELVKQLQDLGLLTPELPTPEVVDRGEGKAPGAQIKEETEIGHLGAAGAHGNDFMNVWPGTTEPVLIDTESAVRLAHQILAIAAWQNNNEV